MTTDHAVSSPTVFKVENTVLIGLATCETKVFLADVTACAGTGAPQVFSRVFFVEVDQRCAMIAGCETESLTVRHPRESPVQMNILKFLRENNRQEQEQFGMVLDRSNARDSSEARLTQAYIEARGLQYSLRVGYCDSDGLFRVTHLPPLIEAQAAKESTSDRLSLV